MDSVQELLDFEAKYPSREIGQMNNVKLSDHKSLLEDVLERTTIMYNYSRCQISNSSNN